MAVPRLVSGSGGACLSGYHTKACHALSDCYGSTDITFGEDKNFISVKKSASYFSGSCGAGVFGMKGAVIMGNSSYKAQESPNPFAVCMVKAGYEKKTNSIILRHVIEVVDVGTPINPSQSPGRLRAG
ncbi:MAG: hypothetical protein ACLRMZ_20255 [Blautia marasmi]